MATTPEILSSKILIVDDDEEDIMLIKSALEEAGFKSISSTTDPRKAFGLHLREHFSLVILDILMPYLDGYEVMEQLKVIEKESYLPVLVMTHDAGAMSRALKAGAKDLLSKDFDPTELQSRAFNMIEVRLLHKELRETKDKLEQRVRERTSDLENSYQETIVAMTRAAEFKDKDTGEHLNRISHYCRVMAADLDLDTDYQEQIFFASPMHDIGKIGIPDHILLKTDGLSLNEWEIMKGHSELGRNIIGHARSPYLKMGAEIALCHHETWDGSGYPNHLAGDSIPFSARIMNICDVYDALRSKRPYKPALDHDTAVKIITQGDGRTMPEQFDKTILHSFIQIKDTFGKIYESLNVKGN
jgi:putative two-component system response regulator